MPTPSAAKLLATIFAGAVSAAVVAAGACSSTGGVTPTCTYNVDDAGNIDPSATGCVQFATCYDDAGNAAAPATCCVYPGDGGPYVGSDLANCLYGYGACPMIQTDDAGNSTCDGGPGGGTGGGGAGGGDAGDAGGDGG
jgi:hypothetical protein